jgi:putative nucleotidyltransferase with HDIG domain
MAEEIEHHLRTRIDAGTVPLPPMPHAVMQCLRLFQSPDVPMESVARVLETDPPLAARVVRVANSPRFATLQRAANLRQAMMRLGLREMKRLVTEAAVRSVFGSRDARIADACQGIWTHSRAVGLLARELAVWVKAGNPEEAYLAGLLHDVGKPIVAGFLLEMERATVGRQISAWMKAGDWIRLVQRIHRPVGLAFGARWQMPAPVLKAIEGCSDYRQNADKSLANCVRLANQWAKRLGIYVGQPDYGEVDLLITEGISLLGLEPRQVEDLGAGLDELLAEE